jgi:integrase
MSVRKRKWITRAGEEREAWIVDYFDQAGDRHIRTFERKKEADEFRATVAVDIRAGLHTAASKSITVRRAADDWLSHIEREERERSTLAQYRQHVRHILPLIGNVKLSELTMPRVQRLRDDLLANHSRALARKVLVSFKSILREAQRRGNVAQNVALGVSIGTDKRGKAKLKAGVDIPTPDEVRRIIGSSTGRMRALLMVAVFSGLRASELRGLRWEDMNLKRGELYVRQRADRYGEIGAPKSAAGERTIPVGPVVVNTLKEWRLASKGALVFPTSSGRINHHKNIARALEPVMVRAGVVDAGGKPKYTLHALRHFYASWCINRRADGGLELPAKMVQERLGHASMVITMDTYGHLFPRGDDGAELAAAERALFGVSAT